MIKMSKVYLYRQKFFQYLGLLAIGLGVSSCATTQTSAAASGETDGVYYSPSKDGQVEAYVANTKESYDIEVGSPYFDEKGNGAEEFYYDENATAQSSNNVQVYTGSNPVYVTPGGGTDWGRYDGIDITVNNYGWNNPMWGFGYNSWYWGYPRFGGYYSSYYGWGGYYGHNPYFGWGGYYNNWYSPYWGYGHGYYGHGYHNHYSGYYGGYYNRGTAIQSGYRPGSLLAYSGGSPYRDNVRRGSTLNTFNQNSTRQIRSGNDRSLNNTTVRPVRQVAGTTGQNNNVRSSEGNVRPTRTESPTVRTNQGSEVKPVRGTRPDNVRPNTPVRTNQDNNIRVTPNTRSNNNVNQPTRGTNNNVRSNDSYTPSRSSSPSIRSSSPAPSRGSGNSGGTIRSGGGSRR